MRRHNGKDVGAESVFAPGGSVQGLVEGTGLTCLAEMRS